MAGPRVLGDVSGAQQALPVARLPHLDGIRALAALYVVVGHARMTVWPWNLGRRPPPVAAILTNWMVWGRIGVAIFIVLSGFCLALPVVSAGGMLRGGARSFFRRRARRILPPFYASLLVTALAISTIIGSKTGTQWDHSLPATTSAYVANLFLVQDVVGSGKISYPFWSVAVEWQIYFLFPLIVFCWRRFGVTRATFWTIVSAYCFWIASEIVGRHGSFDAAGFNFTFVALFVLGMLSAKISFSAEAVWTRIRQLVPWGIVTTGLAAAGLLFSWLGSTRPALLSQIDLPVGVFAAALLVAASRPGVNRLRTCLSWKPLVFVGGFSYSLYLMHAPLLQIVWLYVVKPFNLGPGPGLVALELLGIPLVVTAAYLFYRVFERPFVSGSRKRRPTSATQPEDREFAAVMTGTAALEG